MGLVAVTLGSLAAASCATSNVGLRRDQPPLLVGTGAHTVHIFSAAGVELFSQAWRPKDAPPKAILIIQHGLRDHGDHYVHVAEALTTQGIAVYAMDLPGHGRSAGRRVAIENFSNYVDALGSFVTHVKQTEPGVPVFVFGHSMGGVIVGLWGERNPEQASGIILSAPALHIAKPAIAAAALRLAGILVPNLGVLAVDNAGFSSDAAMTAGMATDPLIFQPGGPAATAQELVSGIEQFWRQLDALKTPLLLLHGTSDQLTAPAGSRTLYQTAPASDKTLRLYPGLVHDLVHEPDGGGTQVIADIGRWIDAHTGGAASNFAAPDVAQRLGGEALGPSISAAFDITDRITTNPKTQHDVRFGLRARSMFGARPGYAVGLDANVGSASGLVYRVAAYPLGIGVAGNGQLLSLTTGVGVSGAPNASARLEVPVSLDAGLQLGPVRALAWGRLAWTKRDGFDGAPWEVALGVRLGRAHYYWPGAVAGLGPYLVAVVNGAGTDGGRSYGVALGFDLAGGR